MVIFEFKVIPSNLFALSSVRSLEKKGDDSLFSRIVDTAIQQGIAFMPDQVDWLIGNVDEAVLTKAVKACTGPFSREQLEKAR